MDIPTEQWLAQIDDLIIKREMQIARLDNLEARLRGRGVKRSTLAEARDRVEQALERLSKHRADLVAKL